MSVALLVLAALYVSLGRELMPLVAEYRFDAESRAQQALGMPLRITSLEGGWKGLSPILSANGVQVGEGEQSIHLDHIKIVPDVVGSLLALKPQVARIEFDGLNLVVEQSPEGGWAVKGLPERKDHAPLDLPKLFGQMQMIKRITLTNSQVTVLMHGQDPVTLSYANLSFNNGARKQSLEGRLRLPDGQPVALKLATSINVDSLLDSRADVYLTLPQSDWAAWLPKTLLGKWRVEHLQLGGEVWAAVDKGAVSRAVTHLHGQDIKAAYADRKPVSLDGVSLNAYYDLSKQGSRLLLDNLAFNNGDVRWGDTDITVTRQLATAEDGEHWKIGIDRFDLGPLLPLVTALAPVPDEQMLRVEQLAPRGELRNIQLQFRPGADGPERFNFAANLRRVSISPSQGVPGAENVSGSISGDLGQGELRVDTQDFALHLNTLFPKPWHYQTAKALLKWQLDADAFTLRAPYLQVVGEEGPVAGDFLIRLRKDPALEDYMDLRVGLRNGDARFTEKYLPSLSPGLSKPLDQWLKTAIRGGAVDEGFFQYQGSLNKGAAPEARSISLFFAVHDAELAFQPGWPSLQEGRGTVFVEDSGVRVALDSGCILDSQVTNATALVPAVKPGESPHLLVEGSLNSSLPDALKILQEAPIGTQSVFDGWEGKGDLDGKLDLNIPLRKGEAPVVVVDFAADDAELSMPTPALQFSHLKGAFRYDTRSGLSAPDIRAQVLGHSVRAKAFAEGRGGKARSRIEATGQIGLETLTGWLGVDQPLPLSGRIPYFVNLTLEGPDSQLRVSSSLKGLKIDLPAPFGKLAEEERPSVWRMTLGGAERRYWFDYAALASLSFAASPGQFNQGRGELRLADGPARLPAARGLQVRGRLAELNWSKWQEAIKPYAKSSGTQSLQLFRDAQVRLGRFEGFGVSVNDAEVGLSRVSSSWRVSVDSKQVSGQVSLPDQSGAPIALNFNYLRLPPRKTGNDSTEDVDSPDTLASIDPRSVPALDVKVDAVFLGDEALGGWKLKARPSTAGVRFSELDLNLKGLKIAGESTWEHGPQGVRTLYKGRLGGRDLAQVLRNWGFAPTATSESFRLDVDGNWPGSPAWFSLKRFSGSLDASLRKGQFSEVDGTASALRVFGLLNFNSIGRRLRLDFSDLLDKGLSYDRFKGVLAASNGVYVTRRPITLEGPSSNLELDGTLDMVSDRIDAKLLVTLPVSNNLPLAALIVGAPAIGGALFVVDKLLGDHVARFASVQYDVKGPWQDPQITFDKPFEKPR
ncbi:YhdP family protein [Ectopseudomonas mendocina]|uniref:YhdP family protein n=1 Tax=Ectopseudomonas mendocina TaxID=300 RepID=A0ABZ2RKS0_ECTME